MRSLRLLFRILIILLASGQLALAAAAAAAGTAPATSTRETSNAYDHGGNVTRKVLPNGNRTDTTRDLLGRKLKIEERTAAGALVSGYDYSAPVGGWPNSYDTAGNVLRCA